MKKLALGVILFTLLIVFAWFVFAEENVTCSSNADCGNVTETFSCANSTHLCNVTITPTCYNASTNESSCNNVTTEDCEECDYTCENNSCIEEAVCSSENLSLCLNETSCEGAGGEWKNATCVEKEDNETEDEEENETEVQVCSTITSRALCEARKNCQYNDALRKCVKVTKIKKLKETLQDYLNSSECPENCVCAGSTIKCETENGRVMTIVAGKSGNIIIQTKTVNATTTVILIKNATGLFGNFSGKWRKIKYMPDEIREKILKKLKMRNCSECNITLKDDGSYEMNVERTYRVIWIFPRKIIEVSKIDSETGEIIIIKRPWWRFLAAKNKE